MAYSTTSPTTQASTMRQKPQFSRRVIRPMTSAMGIRPSRKPKVGMVTYIRPPPSVKIGTPARPSRTYTACEAAPYLGPISSPAAQVKNACKVNEVGPTGMRRNAPMAVRAAKSAVRMMERVRRADLDMVGSSGVYN